MPAKVWIVDVVVLEAVLGPDFSTGGPGGPGRCGPWSPRPCLFPCTS